MKWILDAPVVRVSFVRALENDVVERGFADLWREGENYSGKVIWVVRTGATTTATSFSVDLPAGPVKEVLAQVYARPPQKSQSRARDVVEETVRITIEDERFLLSNGDLTPPQLAEAGLDQEPGETVLNAWGSDPVRATSVVDAASLNRAWQLLRPYLTPKSGAQR